MGFSIDRDNLERIDVNMKRMVAICGRQCPFFDAIQFHRSIDTAGTELFSVYQKTSVLDIKDKLGLLARQLLIRNRTEGRKISKRTVTGKPHVHVRSGDLNVSQQLRRLDFSIEADRFSLLSQPIFAF